jgi:putative hemolysin
MQPLIPVIISLLLSAFFSGIETAFASSNKLKIEVDKGRKLFSASILSRFVKNPAVFISTLWLGNIVALVGYAHYADTFFKFTISEVINPAYSSHPITILIEITILALTYFIIAEVLPRILFRINPNNILKAFALPVFVVYLVFFPIIKLFIFLAEFILRFLFNVSIDKKEYTFSTFDLDNLINETNIEPSNGTDDFQELQMFKNARDLSNIKLRDFMVPRNEIVAIEKDDTIQNLIDLITESGHSKILVYQESIDDIIGYSHSYDMFAKPLSISQIIKPVIIVPGTMAADSLLNTFIRERKSVALVVDEFGGTAGMLTIEDILEEIFGDIEDEYDVDEFEDKRINEHEYLVSGRLDIDYLNEKYDLGLPESDEYKTIAGYIIFIYKNIPAENEEIVIGNLTFLITKASESKIEQVLVRVS